MIHSAAIPERSQTQPIHRYVPYRRQLSHWPVHAASTRQRIRGPCPSMSDKEANPQSYEEPQESKALFSCIAGTSVKPSEARRDAAIILVLSFFTSSATNTTFSGPDVQITDPLPSVIPSRIKQYGRLRVPANTELRLRYWHMLDPTASIDDLLRRCLMKSLPYRIFLPTGALSSPNHSFFRNHALSVDKANLLEQGQTKRVSAAMVQKYFENISGLLSQPDAHKFLECGGLLSRIARHYAPGLLVCAFNGPPSDGQGTELSADGTSCAHHVRHAEIQTLIGLTTNSSSLWPFPDRYENSDKYNGEWTQANETWFLKQATKIQGCAEGCLRSGRDWQNAVRGHTNVQIASPTTIGTVEHAKASCDKLVMEYPEIWSNFDRIMSFTLLHPGHVRD
jgi:hypothetical protein